MIKYDANSLFEAVYDGSVTPRKLPEQLYAEIAEILKKGVDKGFNKGAQATGERFAKYELGSVDAALIEELTLNIYMFSAAKTFQQILEMSNALVVDGRVATFSEFKSEANKIFEIYNKTWLRTEYDTTIGQSQNARRWSVFEQEKDLFPYLEYDAVMDANTSEICRPLDKIILPVGDPFWNTHAPLNHFKCRCFLRKISKFDDVKQTAKSKLNRVSKEINPMMQEVFKVNPGKTGECFDSAHPYFNVPKKYTKFAETNFGLPIPPKK